MSEHVTLTLRVALDGALEVEGVAGDRFATLSEGEIGALPVWLGARTARLGDFFDISGERSSTIRVVGAVGTIERVNGLGEGMSAGELTIDGDAGARVGARMTGGRLDVLGNVGDDAGMAMGGGVLNVRGHAGDRLGAAAPGASKGMTGGEIVVAGSAGADAGARARRGLIVVGGDAGRDAARATIAGTLVVFGRTGLDPGRASKRGSIIALGEIVPPATYWYACTYQPPHVRLTLTYLRRQYGLSVDARMLDGRYRRYCGDSGTPGRGEILELVAS
jgi:formylmethanofuran dehydrogenase subunit C